MKLIPITYHNKKYPSNIISNIDEIAGNLDKSKITPTRSYSLHTEYSHMKRKLDSCLLDKYKVLKESHKNYVPKLWASKEWAIEFANFIIDLIGDNKAPEIIEIHPPFDDYCNNFEEFFDIYEEFEKIIRNLNPHRKNRWGFCYISLNNIPSYSIARIRTNCKWFFINLQNFFIIMKKCFLFSMCFSGIKGTGLPTLRKGRCKIGNGQARTLLNLSYFTLSASTLFSSGVTYAV